MLLIKWGYAVEGLEAGGIALELNGIGFEYSPGVMGYNCRVMMKNMLARFEWQ